MRDTTRYERLIRRTIAEQSRLGASRYALIGAVEQALTDATDWAERIGAVNTGKLAPELQAAMRALYRVFGEDLQVTITKHRLCGFLLALTSE